MNLFTKSSLPLFFQNVTIRVIICGVDLSLLTALFKQEYILNLHFEHISC